ncbi:MAG TPA: tetratricopeptide repeat protein [Planctomycetota bacterium]
MDPFQGAFEMLAGGRPDLAEPLIRRGLQRQPDSPFGHALLALCFHHRDDHAAAEREAREAVAQAPDVPFCHYVLGRVLLSAKRIAEAETAALTALDLLPENEGHLALLGQIRIAQKRGAEALELAERGLAIDPNDLNCLNLRIVALRELGRNAEAQLAAREILQRHPEDEVAHIQAGLARSMVGDDDAGRAHFAEALRIDPTNQPLARAFERRSGGFLWVIGAVFAVAGALTPWTKIAMTGRSLRGLTWILPLVVLGAAWGRRKRLLASLAAVAALLTWAWFAFKGGRLTEARLALSAAAVASLVPAGLALRGV